MAVRWKHIYTGGSFDRTASYSYTSKSGKYYIKTVSNYAGTSIERYPNYRYFERNMLGDNKGTRIRVWERI